VPPSKESSWDSVALWGLSWGSRARELRQFPRGLRCHRVGGRMACGILEITYLLLIDGSESTPRAFAASIHLRLSSIYLALAGLPSIGWFTVAQLGTNLGSNLVPNFDQVGNRSWTDFAKSGCKSCFGPRFASQL